MFVFRYTFVYKLKIFLDKNFDFQKENASWKSYKV